MKFHDREAPKTILETEGRSPLTRREVMEMHLFAKEEALCGRGLLVHRANERRLLPGRVPARTSGREGLPKVQGPGGAARRSHH